MNHEKVRLNKKMPLVSVDEIKQARENARNDGKDYPTLGPQIDTDKRTIRALYEKERDLITQLPARIEKTVKKNLTSNIKDTWNDGFAGGAQIS